MITPILLCGGSGTRLWPLSRKAYPKQFSPLIGEQSLFQASALRFSGEGFQRPLIVSNADFRFIVAEQLMQVGVDPGTILIEPEARNTAPAILAAALHLYKTDPDGLMLVAPSDHVVPNAPAFRAAVAEGQNAALDGQLVTFGISADRAETGYGYLELSAPVAASSEPQKLERFIEKPDAVRASAMVEAGHYLWNAGIFLFSARAILKAYRAHAPAMVDAVMAALDSAQCDLGFLRLAEAPWSVVEDISIDHAIMENATNLSVVPFSEGWSDLGDWEAVWRETPVDELGVATTGPTTALDCKDSLLRAENSQQQLVGIGLQNIVAVAMPDAVLVADLSHAQNVKTAVAQLKALGTPQATCFPKVYRPWGWFESLSAGPNFLVKRVTVKPGAKLSLQSHKHRSEHWVVVEGTARVTLADTITDLTENQSTYVPVGTKHRLENPTDLPMTLIEVQTGDYLGEDDITRYDDMYDRI